MVEWNILINVVIGLDELKDIEVFKIVVLKEFLIGNIIFWDDYKVKIDFLGLLESYNWKFVRDCGGDVILSKLGVSDLRDMDVKIIKVSNGDFIFYFFIIGMIFELRKNYNVF